MNDSTKKGLIIGGTGVVALIAGVVIFKSMSGGSSGTSNADIANSAKEVTKNSNSTDVLSPAQQEWVKNAGRGPGSMKKGGTR